MFGCRKNSDKIVAMASLLILGGVLPLAGAYMAQMAFGLKPCHFCMLQRYPYLLVILAGFVTLIVPRMGLRWRAAVAFGILGLLATGLLGAIHTGIESGLLQYKGGCVAQAATGQSLDAIRAAIFSAPLVSCNDVSAQFLGLSMAGWNVLWAVFILLLIALQYRFEYRRYVRS